MLQLVETCKSCNKTIGQSLDAVVNINDAFKYTIITRICGDCRRNWNLSKILKVMKMLFNELKNIKIE
jgi:hypothetical protein